MPVKCQSDAIIRIINIVAPSLHGGAVWQHGLGPAIPPACCFAESSWRWLWYGVSKITLWQANVNMLTQDSSFHIIIMRSLFVDHISNIMLELRGRTVRWDSTFKSLMSLTHPVMINPLIHTYFRKKSLMPNQWGSGKTCKQTQFYWKRITYQYIDGTIDIDKELL